MYIRKEIRDFINNMPKEMKLPKDWKKFVKENSVEYNLILKHGKEHECTNCHKYFTSDIPIGEYDECPFCKNSYIVRRSNLKNYFFLSDLALCDNVNNKFIIRYFENRTYYNYQKRKFENNIVEYARIIPELQVELVNDRFIKYLSSEHILHYKKITKWRVFTGMCELNQYYRVVYLNNLEEKTKGTIYQYAPLREAIKYLDNDRVDMKVLLSKAKYPSFELLMKAGLYNLALNCPEKFNEKCSFEKKFGVSKDYYTFMKKHNITYLQLEVLKIIKRKNMKIINKILKIGFDNIQRINKASEYVNLIKLEEYSRKHKNFTLSSYLDYLRNLEKLEVPFVKNKKLLFPEDFWKAHDESVKKVKIVGNKGLDRRIKARYEELSKNIYINEKYFIRPAKSLKDMRDEAKQQNNCVYKNYSEKYAFGDTDIYFLRTNKNPEKSLVTIEVNNKKIRQKEQKNHYSLSKEQIELLVYWEKNVIQQVA